LAKLNIDKDACKGCGLCISVCPKKILAMSETKLNESGYSPVEIIDMSLCISCAFCAKMCPDFVFTVEKKTAEDKEDR